MVESSTTMNAAKMNNWCAMKAATWQMDDRIHALQTCARELERNIKDLEEWAEVVRKATEMLDLKMEKVRLLEEERERLLEKPQLRRSARIAARR